MSDRERYGIGRKILLRVEAGCDLCWVAFKLRHEPWNWARENLKPTTGHTDVTAVVEIEKAAHAVASSLPFTALCVPVTTTAMRMLRRRHIAAEPQWVVPGVRGAYGHVTLKAR